MKKYDFIALKDENDVMVIIDCKDIVRIHASGGFATLYTTDKKFIHWSTLKDCVTWFNRTCNVHFFIISRGHAVNFPYIGGYHRNEGLYMKPPCKTQPPLPLSEDGYKLMKRLYPQP